MVNDGVYKSDTLVKPSTFNTLFEPHSFQGGNGQYPTTALTKPNWNTYGLGWFQQDYRGHKLDFHTGSIAGLIAIAGIMHEKDLAVYVFANLDHAELRHAILFKAIDLYAFDDDSRDWHKEIFDLYSGFRNEAKAAHEKQLKAQIKETKPSLPLKDYQGTYTHKMLGEIIVSASTDALQLNFNDYKKYTATHWHYDTFKTNKDSKWRDSIMATFVLNADGKINEMNVMGEVFIKNQ